MNTSASRCALVVASATGAVRPRARLGGRWPRWAAVLLAPTVMAVCRPAIGMQDVAPERAYDVVIYGGTSAAVSAGVQSARMGRSVAIVCPEEHLGGMTSNGLGWTDSGNKAVIGGIAREFYRRIKRHYDRPGAWIWDDRDRFGGYRAGEDAMWVFEPHVAEAVFEEMIAEAGVDVLRGRWLDRSGSAVEKDGARITAIRMLGGETLRARVFIDSTYEGDLMAAAGVTYTVGREPNARYGETLNGVQTANAHYHQFPGGVDPYIRPGDPASGLLPRIQAGPPGRDGEDDRRVQAYNYRLCMTRVTANRVPFTRPEGYDAAQYEVLLRYLLATDSPLLGSFGAVPNGKTDTNNNGPFSTDNIGMNYDYPEASYERRAEILAEHETYQRGYFYFLASDPRVPEDVRSRMSEWGLAADEFTDNGNWPRQIYVREARRMVSDFVMTEPHLRGAKPTPRPIGMGSYNMDSHNVQRYVAHDEDGRAFVRNEGDVQVGPGGPYPIGYGAIAPNGAECENLLVPVCLSSSHIAYGSIRMEPVFMILGQSAATAASLAVESGAAVQDVEYAALRERLLADGQVLEFPGAGQRRALDPAKLAGVVVDDVQAARQGQWTESASVSGYVGRGYLHDGSTGKGGSTVSYEVTVPRAGTYELRIAYTPHANRAPNVPVTFEAGGLRTTTLIDQRQKPPVDDMWFPLGTVSVEAGAKITVRIANNGTEGYVVADALQVIDAP